jgi:hypothetical protein
MDVAWLFRRRIEALDAALPELRRCLYANPLLTIDVVLEDIERHPDKKHLWASPYATGKNGVRLESYEQHFPATPIASRPCSYENLSLDFVLRHPELPWDWESLSHHENIPVDQILAHPELPWVYSERGVSAHPGLRLEHIQNNPALPWDRSVAFRRALSPRATYDQIMAAPDEPWSPECLASPNISSKEQLLDVLVPFFKVSTVYSTRYIWQNLCLNKNLTFRDLYAFFCRGVLDISREDAFVFLCNPNITTADLAELPNEKWRYDFLSSVLPAEYLMKNKLNWDWQIFLQYNKEATCEILERLPPELRYGVYWYHPNPRYWKWASLFSNEHASRRDKERCLREILQIVQAGPIMTSYYMPVVASPLFLEPTFEEIREHLAKRRIVRLVVRALSDPRYAQCRKRLLREHSGLARME